MNVRDLETLYDYSYRANAKLFEPLSLLPPLNKPGTLDNRMSNARFGRRV